MMTQDASAPGEDDVLWNYLEFGGNILLGLANRAVGMYDDKYVCVCMCFSVRERVCVSD